MIDGIVLTCLDHGAKVMHLEDEHAGLAHQAAHRRGETVDVLDVGKDIVRHHHVGLAAGIDRMRPQVFLQYDGVADCVFHGCIGRIDACNLDAQRRQRAQHGAVVAADLYHMARGVPGRDVGSVGGEVVPHGAAGR